MGERGRRQVEMDRYVLFPSPAVKDSERRAFPICLLMMRAPYGDLLSQTFLQPDTPTFSLNLIFYSLICLKGKRRQGRSAFYHHKITARVIKQSFSHCGAARINNSAKKHKKPHLEDNSVSARLNRCIIRLCPLSLFLETKTSRMSEDTIKVKVREAV